MPVLEVVSKQMQLADPAAYAAAVGGLDTASFRWPELQAAYRELEARYTVDISIITACKLLVLFDRERMKRS